MKFILDFVKGIFVGIANIIPGVSGGTMAVSMGVYDKIITSLNNLIKKFKKSFITLLPLMLGMVVGIAAFSFIIPYCLNNYSFQTCMCFTGLIIGGIPEIVMYAGNALKENNKKLSPAHIIAFVLLMAVAIWMALANPSGAGAKSIDISFAMILRLFLYGIIAAATMVIPGVSGSLVLMLLGYYSAIMGTISSFILALKAFDFSALLNSVLILLPFGIGCVLGILLISKLITWLLNKAPSITYCAILGLITASPFAILYKMKNPSYTPLSIIIGILLLIGGAAFTYFFSKKKSA